MRILQKWDENISVSLYFLLEFNLIKHFKEKLHPIKPH